MGQRYFTALEIAEAATRLQVAQMPMTKDGVLKYIKRESWDQGNLWQNRQGREGGGGREYHISLFPEFLANAILADQQREQALIDAKRADEERRQDVMAFTKAKLTANQRKVAEGRAALLQELRVLEIENGWKQGKAVLELIKLCKSEARLEKLARQANHRAGSDRTVSRSQVYSWIKAMKADGFMGLVPKLGKKIDEFPVWFGDFLSFYARPQAPTISDALEQLRYNSNLVKVPSYDTVRRTLKKLDATDGTQARHKGREGALALKARHAYVLRDTSGLLPTSVYTADGKTFDAEVQHPIHGRPFRPEITTILDVRTRKCVGWSVGLAENAKDVREALRRACVDFGIPAIFYVDRGPGFKNDALDNKLSGFCGRLGITKTHSLPYNSQARGIIERYNGSILNPLAKQFDSYIGADMDREARHLSYKKSRKEISEIGVSALIPTMTEFVDALNEQVIKYNDSLHSGLEHRDKSGRKHKRTPNQVWQQAENDGFQAVFVLPQEADDLFRPYVARTTRRGMVNWNSNSYFHMDLEKYDGLEILVGYDFRDGSQVWCREIELVNGEKQSGALIAVAKFEGNKERYVPLSMEQKAIETRAAGRMRRLDEKIKEVQDEANPNRFLTLDSSPALNLDMSAAGVPLPEPNPTLIGAASGGQVFPAQSSTLAAPTGFETTDFEDVEPQAPKSKKTRTNSNGRPIFDDDASMALWCCENPDQFTEEDRSFLTPLVRNRNDRDYLRLHGVDLRVLEELIKSAA